MQTELARLHKQLRHHLRLRDPRAVRGLRAGRPHRHHERGPHPAGRPPQDVYRAPVNAFVADFIGMNNLIRGEVAATQERASLDVDSRWATSRCRRSKRPRRRWQGELRDRRDRVSLPVMRRRSMVIAAVGRCGARCSAWSSSARCRRSSSRCRTARIPRAEAAARDRGARPRSGPQGESELGPTARVAAAAGRLNSRRKAMYQEHFMKRAIELSGRHWTSRAPSRSAAVVVKDGSPLSARAEPLARPFRSDLAWRGGSDPRCLSPAAMRRPERLRSLHFVRALRDVCRHHANRRHLQAVLRSVVEAAGRAFGRPHAH